MLYRKPKDDLDIMEIIVGYASNAAGPKHSARSNYQLEFIKAFDSAVEAIQRHEIALVDRVEDELKAEMFRRAMDVVWIFWPRPALESFRWFREKLERAIGNARERIKRDSRIRAAAARSSDG